MGKSHREFICSLREIWMPHCLKMIQLTTPLTTHLICSTFQLVLILCWWSRSKGPAQAVPELWKIMQSFSLWSWRCQVTACRKPLFIYWDIFSENCIPINFKLCDKSQKKEEVLVLPRWLLPVVYSIFAALQAYMGPLEGDCKDWKGSLLDYCGLLGILLHGFWFPFPSFCPEQNLNKEHQNLHGRLDYRKKVFKMIVR